MSAMVVSGSSRSRSQDLEDETKYYGVMPGIIWKGLATRTKEITWNECGRKLRSENRRVSQPSKFRGVAMPKASGGTGRIEYWFRYN